MKGCLSVIGGTVVVLVLFVMCSAAMVSNSGSHERKIAASSYSAPRSDSNCQTASSRERQAAAYINNDQYQKTYDTAMSGLHYVSLCDDEDDNLLNKAYLMSFKALAEHHLSSGDSKTDLNEANMLLEECVTHPGFYGTHVGAQCETQQKNNISTETSWEMEQYSQ